MFVDFSYRKVGFKHESWPTNKDIKRERLGALNFRKFRPQLFILVKLYRCRAAWVPRDAS